MLTTRCMRSVAQSGMMDKREEQIGRRAPGPARGRLVVGRRWHWQTIVAALLALLVVEGQPVAASQALAGPAARAAEMARRQVAPLAGHDGSASAQAAREPNVSVRNVAKDDRPDFRVTFAALEDARVGQPFSYTIQVRNDGAAAGVASVSAVVPLELSNVRVSAPGFVCTRRFTPSGSQAGTMVACMRNDLEGGATADVTIEASAPSAAGTYHLTATADPRDEVAEANEANNEADVTVRIHG
jgi:hypothetical protein